MRAPAEALLIPLPVLPPKPPRAWKITLSNASQRQVEAHGFRVEHGALILLLPAGCVAAFADGRWVEIEENTDG